MYIYIYIRARDRTTHQRVVLLRAPVYSSTRVCRHPLVNEIPCLAPTSSGSEVQSEITTAPGKSRRSAPSHQGHLSSSGAPHGAPIPRSLLPHLGHGRKEDMAARRLAVARLVLLLLTSWTSLEAVGGPSPEWRAVRPDAASLRYRRTEREGQSPHGDRDRGEFRHTTRYPASGHECPTSRWSCAPTQRGSTAQDGPVEALRAEPQGGVPAAKTAVRGSAQEDRGGHPRGDTPWAGSGTGGAGHCQWPQASTTASAGNGSGMGRPHEQQRRAQHGRGLLTGRTRGCEPGEATHDAGSRPQLGPLDDARGSSTASSSHYAEPTPGHGLTGSTPWARTSSLPCHRGLGQDSGTDGAPAGGRAFSAFALDEPYGAGWSPADRQHDICKPRSQTQDGTSSSTQGSADSARSHRHWAGLSACRQAGSQETSLEAFWSGPQGASQAGASPEADYGGIWIGRRHGGDQRQARQWAWIWTGWFGIKSCRPAVERTSPLLLAAGAKIGGRLVTPGHGEFSLGNSRQTKLVVGYDSICAVGSAASGEAFSGHQCLSEAVIALSSSSHCIAVDVQFCYFLKPSAIFKADGLRYRIKQTIWFLRSLCVPFHGWQLFLVSALLEKEAPDSNLALIGVRVPTFPSSSRDAGAHWVCVPSTFPSPRLHFSVATCSCGAINFPLALYRAPKRRIGGSGTSAGIGHVQLQPQLGELCFPLQWLDSSGELVVSLSDWLVWAVVLMQQWTLAVLCPFFRHLALLLLWALIGQLLRPFRTCSAPLSGLVLLPTRGLPPALLCFAVVYSVEQQRLQTTQARLRHGARRPKHQRQIFRWLRGPWPSASLCSWFWSSFLLGLPAQVWAAPSSLHELVSGAQHSAEFFPEHLNNAAQGGACTEQRRVQDDLRESLLHHAISHDLGRPLADTDELPVPPLHPPPEVGSAHEPTVEGFCFALAPQYQAEVLKLTLRPPLDLATFISAARDAVLHLRLPFCCVIAPTFPQLGPDFASIVLAPKWLPQAGRQLVVFDFRAIDDGPVYARLTHNRVSHQECEQEAVHQGYRHTSIYVQGHSRALAVGDTFLAVLGCVVQFQPRDRPAQWCSTLADRFDRPQGWSTNPHLPIFPRDRPVLALHHDHSTLYSASRFPGVPTLGFLAGLVDRTPERTLYISPPSSALTNIDFRGVACRDVLAVFPLTPVLDRTGILVFLDPRQADKEVTHVYLPSGTTDPQFLVRFLALRPPRCYRVAILPRPGRAGLLHLSEGDIVTFGYKEDHPWSTEDDSSSSQEAAESAPGHTSDAEVSVEDAADNSLDTLPAPRGPPPPVPVTSQHSPSRVPERSRTRSPRSNRNSAPSRPATPGSGSALAASFLGVTLGLSQPGAAEGSLNTPARPTTGLPDMIGMFQVVLQYGVIVCVAFVVLWRMQRGLCHVFARALATSGIGHQVAHKLLTEPAGRTHIETRMLQRLRAATRRLGGRWITDPPLHLQGLMPLQPADEGPSDFDADEEFQTVPCIILCPEYTAELADIRIPLPATVDEVTDALHTARQSARAADFPRLVPVLPQPSHGLAAFIAYPAWHFNDVLVCIDTAAIDGRLFATRSPAYVCKSDLIRLAGLLPGLDYEVFYNVDQELLGDRPVHLFPGVLITFLHMGSIWPAQYDLVTLLQSYLAWGDVIAPPIPRYADAHCLVHDEVATLCVGAGHHPVRYRDTIAYATGVDPSRMRLFAAAPHPGDSTLQGVPCGTVLAVGLPPMHNPDSVWHYALLDCRPLLASWRTLCVSNGYVLQRLLFAGLAKHVPLDWELRLDGQRETSGVLWFAPGQSKTCLWGWPDL